MRNKALSTLAVVAAICCGVFASAPAMAASEQASDRDSATLKSGLVPSQGMPIDLRDRVQILMGQSSSSLVNDLSWDEAAKTLSVHVVGERDAVIRPLLEKQLAGHKFNIVHDTYSFDTLSSQAAKLVETAASRGIAVASISHDVNNSGLAVALAEAGEPTSPSWLARDTAVLEDLSPVPLTVVSTPDFATESSGWRWGDQPSFWGGSRIYSGGEACSSAFPVIARGTGAAALAMLTADHCGSIGDAWRSGQTSSNWAIGTMTSGNSGGSDIHRLGGQAYQGAVYVGEYNSGTAAALDGAYYPVAGDTVCASGAYSGLVCDNKVQSTGDVICYQAFHCYVNLVTVVNSAKIAMWGNGDSGGPVVVGSATGGALAVGIISGMSSSGTAACKGYPGGNGRVCSTIGYFANIRAFLDNNSGWKILTYN